MLIATLLMMAGEMAGSPSSNAVNAIYSNLIGPAIGVALWFR